MRILIVRGYGKMQDMNAYNSQEMGLAKALVNKGHSVDIAYFNGNKSMNSIYKHGNANINLIGLNGKSFFSQGIFSNLQSIFKSYDFIWTNEINQFASHIFLKTNQKGVVYHGPYFNNSCSLRNLRDKFFSYLYGFTNKKSKKILTKSILAEKTLKQLGYSNVQTIGVGLDTSKFFIEKDRKRIKNNILYIGELSDRRNILFIIDIFKRIQSYLPDSTLTLIGNGKASYVRKVKNKINDNDLGEKVTLLSKVNNDKVSYYYNRASLFLFPTKYEIFGMVLLEAMFHGVPVLTSNNGGSNTIIIDKKNGFVLTNFNLETWVSRCLTILANSNENVSRNAHDTIINKYTWENVVDNAKIF